VVGLKSELRIYSAVIWPHYGDTTDDVTPAGQNEHQYKRTRATNDGKNGNQPSHLMAKREDAPPQRKANFEMMMAKRKGRLKGKLTEKW
jgi:hypothetical protein